MARKQSYDWMVRSEIFVPIMIRNLPQEQLIIINLFGMLDFSMINRNPSNAIIPTNYKIEDYKNIKEENILKVDEFIKNWFIFNKQKVKEVCLLELGELALNGRNIIK